MDQELYVNKTFYISEYADTNMIDSQEGGNKHKHRQHLYDIYTHYGYPNGLVFSAPHVQQIPVIPNYQTLPLTIRHGQIGYDLSFPPKHLRHILDNIYLHKAAFPMGGTPVMFNIGYPYGPNYKLETTQENMKMAMQRIKDMYYMNPYFSIMPVGMSGNFGSLGSTAFEPGFMQSLFNKVTGFFTSKPEEDLSTKEPSAPPAPVVHPPPNGALSPTADATLVNDARVAASTADATETTKLNAYTAAYNAYETAKSAAASAQTSVNTIETQRITAYKEARDALNNRNRVLYSFGAAAAERSAADLEYRNKYRVYSEAENNYKTAITALRTAQSDLITKQRAANVAFNEYESAAIDAKYAHDVYDAIYLGQPVPKKPEKPASPYDPMTGMFPLGLRLPGPVMPHAAPGTFYAAPNYDPNAPKTFQFQGIPNGIPQAMFFDKGMRYYRHRGGEGVQTGGKDPENGISLFWNYTPWLNDVWASMVGLNPFAGSDVPEGPYRPLSGEEINDTLDMVREKTGVDYEDQNLW